MKKLNLFSRMCSPRVGSRKDESSTRLRLVFDSFTCRLRVWQVISSRMAAVFLLLLTLSIGNAWGDVTDVLTHTINGKDQTNTTYQAFSNKSFTSDAVYAGQSSNGNNGTIKGVIQLKSAGSTSGIVSTTSGGNIKSITISWNSNTTNGNTIDVYGRNTAYESAADLYSSTAATKGVLLGSIVKGTSTTLNVVGDFAYIGLRSKSGALYMTSVSITWRDVDDPTDYVYNLVTDISDLSDGDRFIILNTGGTYALSTTQNTNNRAGVAAVANNWSIDDNTVTLGASTTVEVMTIGTLNSHKIFVTSTGYLRAAGSSTNYLLKTQETTDTNCEWAISLNGSYEASIVGQGSNTNKTMQFNSNLFACYASASYTALKIYKQEPPTYTVTWAAGNEDEFYTQTDVAGTALESPGTPTPATYCPGGKVFVGWTETPIDGEDDDAPADLFTSVSGMSIPEGGTTYYAVFANSSGGGGESGDITITRTTTNFPSSYGTANTFTEYTLAGYKFKIQQVYNNNTTGQTGSQTMQWRAGGNSNGSGTMYNTEEFPGDITSIVVVYSSYDGNRNISLYVGDSENPTSGTEIDEPTVTSTYTYTFDCSGGSYSYFVLINGSGAGYVESITIYYGSATTYSAYATSCVASCAVPTGLSKGSFNSVTQKLPINWTSTAGKVDICYSSSSTTPGSTPGEGYTVVSGLTGSTSTANIDSLNVSALSADDYYCWVRSVCDADSKSAWTAITDNTFTIPGHTLTISPSPASSGTFDQTSGQTVVEGRTVSITATPASGYNFTSWAVSGTGSTLTSTSTNPTTFKMGTADATVTATFTAKPLTAWTWGYRKDADAKNNTGDKLAIPEVIEAYIGQYVRFDITEYSPSDVIAAKKGYTYTAGGTAPEYDPTKLSYVGADGSHLTYYTTKGLKACDATLTFTSVGNGELTKIMTLRINALPVVKFQDLVHGESFADVVATVGTGDYAGIVTITKTTPIHSDLDEPGSGNSCEKQHLHLVGWIRSDWPDLVAYMNGTGDELDTEDITTAGVDGDSKNYFLTAGASLNTETYNGFTFYAVWSKAE